MKKNYKTMLTAMLTSTVLLAACSSGGNGDGNESASPNVSPYGSSQTEERRVEISILTPDGLNAYAKEVQGEDRYSKEISRLFGHDIKYEWVDHPNYSQLLAVRFASGDLPDIISTGSITDSAHATAVENGIFLELNELLDEHGANIKNHFPEDVWRNEQISKDGKIYGIPVGPALPETRVVYIRKDWLEKLDMETPVTLQDYLDYFEAVRTVDLNGDGRADDQIPFIVHENLGAYNTLFFGYFGVHPNAWSLVDGEIIPDLISPKMKDAIAFWKMLYDNEYINRDLFTKKNNDKLLDICGDKAGMWMHDVQNVTGWFAKSLFNDPDEVELDMLPGPINEDGQYNLIPQGPGFSGIRVINAKSDVAKEAIQFLDWTLSDDEEKNRFFSFGIEGHNYSIENGEIQYDPSAPENLDKDQASYIQVMTYPLGDNRLSEELIELNPEKELIRHGIEVAQKAAYETVNKHMPMLDALAQNPELGDRGGSLFLDMFAKVVTGVEELDSAFDKFVEEWRKRGGDDAIREANEWYNRQ